MPAFEKSLSEGIDVAGVDRYFIANFESNGYK